MSDIRRRLMMNGVGQQEYKTKYLYYFGDQCVDITGGWGYGYRARNAGWGNPGNQSFQTDYMNSRKDNGYGSSAFRTNNKIDLSKYYAIITRSFMNLITQTSGSHGASFCLSDLPDSPWGDGFSGDVSSSGYLVPNRISAQMISAQNVYVYSALELRGNSSYTDVSVYMIAVYELDDLRPFEKYGNTAQEIIENSYELFQHRSDVEKLVTKCTGHMMWDGLNNESFRNNMIDSPFFNVVQSNPEWKKAMRVWDL